MAKVDDAARLTIRSAAISPVLGQFGALADDTAAYNDLVLVRCA